MPSLKQNRHSFEYDQTIPGMVKEIEEVGPGGTPKWVEMYKEAEQLKHPNLYAYQHIGALLSLHSSLATLNQLIFQGIYQDEFLRLTLNHIIDFMWTTAGAGPSMWLMHRPYPIMLICETTDLIIVNTDRPGRTWELGDVLCIIQSKPISFDLSAPSVLRLRMTDERLNAYKYLLPYAVDN